MPSASPKISFIGFGEAAQAFVHGLSGVDHGAPMRAYDIKSGGPAARDFADACARLGIGNASSNAEVCANADIIFSLVTADQAEAAAQEASEHSLNGALYLDGNSCAPETKCRSAECIDKAGGRYVDVAIMTPVHPKLHKSPCLLAGPHGEAARAAMADLGMDVTVAGGEVGDASMRKMIRSVMIKGLEALTLECFLAARKAGIEGELIISLEGSFPGFDWQRRAPYMIERALTHGVRRAAEMREVAQTLRDLNIDPHMVDATVERQHEAGHLGLDADVLGAKDLAALTDGMLSALKQGQPDAE